MFIARRAEGLTASEQQLLADWLARDEVHRRMFDSADRAWQSLKSRRVTRSSRQCVRMRELRGGEKVSYWRPAAAAAALLLVVVAAVLVFLPNLNPSSSSGAPIQYASARGEVKELRLPDGSSMTLDADSAAVGHFSADGRTIELQRGRAFFAVMPDQSKPFAVAAAGRSVVAVGTRFDVNLAADALTVTLLEGKVRVESQDLARAPATLEPGQQYVERLGQATIRTLGTASENAIAWRTGLINFIRSAPG